ncbi:cache domain-containing sensor histidine kinase [Cohnella cholangitidis]|uniref:HAMP domain-containing protein n=1 Tax=Cohnella cholangitidis TaxID=2598458 RepID=A0A7G5C296_9BACL|nr:sensor histidine kinase [Cohnella cholangitidis]QMV43330.1 HAMP domain-containing protein [Cohnella cholangitidis]
MWRKIRNIQTILFSTYTLIIIIVFTILVVWVYMWVSELIKNNATDSLVNIGQSMQDQIDSEIRKMNDVSLNVMYSNLVKNQFLEYLSDIEKQPHSSVPDVEQPATIPGASANSVQSAKELAEILTAAIGPSRAAEQLYLYDFKGKAYGNGFDNGERSYDPNSTPWFQAVMATQGKYITLPVEDAEMSKFISAREKQYSMSLFRQFYDNYNVPIGIVEVKQYYNRIFKSVLSFVKQSTYGESVLVYDNVGQIIYPLQADRSLYEPYIGQLAARQTSNESTYESFRNPVTGDKELLSHHYSEQTGWSTVVIVSEKKLLAPLSDFTRKTLLVAIGILLFAIVLSFIASKKITFPIYRILRTVRNIRLDDLGSGRIASQELNSGLNELDQLHEAFVNMSSRLRQSMDELLLSQSQEVQSKLIALQSQMNPHFLYNTLATIGVMAEENMNEQIVSMSENMSDILRYISSEESSVELRTELLYTRKYLEVNAIRHGQKLKFSFEVDDALERTCIPKLVIQPLVENSLKFATRREPPWNIRIVGVAEGNEWRVTVSDNGPGFSPESMEKLRNQIDETYLTNVTPVLQLGGMGLLNIFIRMRLTYGSDSVFLFGNSSTGGAEVTIGGRLAKGEQA